MADSGLTYTKTAMITFSFQNSNFTLDDLESLYTIILHSQ